MNNISLDEALKYVCECCYNEQITAALKEHVRTLNARCEALEAKLKTLRDSVDAADTGDTTPYIEVTGAAAEALYGNFDKLREADNGSG